MSVYRTIGPLVFFVSCYRNIKRTCFSIQYHNILSLILLEGFCMPFSCNIIYEPLHKKTNNMLSKCKADQLLCFRYSDSTIPLLLISKVSSFMPSSVTVKAGLCQTLSELKLLVFSCIGSYKLFSSPEPKAHR